MIPQGAAWCPPPELRSWPEDLGLLLGCGAHDLLAAVASTSGATLRRWRPRQVTVQPGLSTVVQYATEMGWPGGRATPESVVVAAGDLPPAGAVVLDGGGLRVAAWRWPADPLLPGLATAVDAARVQPLLTGLGLAGEPTLRVRSYRPGRRAVVEAVTPRGRAFLKVVSPRRVQALHGVHRLLAQGLCVPDSAGWSDEGLLVLAALPGTSLRRALASASAALPAPASLWRLLQRLPDELVAGRRRPGPLDRVAHHAETVAMTLPAQRARIGRLLRRLDAAHAPPHPTVAVHGDFYEAQVLVRRGRVTGLLDVDTTGAGARIDDMANLLAHLSVLSLSSPRPSRILRYGTRLLAAAERSVDRADLRRRIAAATVALATGPFRVLEDDWQCATRQRLRLAESWADSAERCAW